MVDLLLISLLIVVKLMGIGGPPAEPEPEPEAQRLARRRARTARALGLAYHRGSTRSKGRIEGLRKGCRVQVFDLWALGLGGVDTRTHFEVAYPRALGLGLSLRREHPEDERREGIDLQIGVPGFDASHRIYGRDASRIAAFLSARRRERIQRLLERYPDARIEDDRLSLELSSSADAEHRMRRTIEDLVGLARDLCEEARPAPLPSRRPARSASARRRRDRATGLIQLEPGMLQALLFRSNLPEAQAARLFERRFHGRRVTLLGRLVSADERRVDTVFGDEPSLRLRIRVEAPTGVPGSAPVRPIFAVARCEPGRVPSAPRGQRLRLVGRLVAMDRFGRELYLDEVELRG